jgi:hypothetical protein
MPSPPTPPPDVVMQREKENRLSAEKYDYYEKKIREIKTNLLFTIGVYVLYLSISFIEYFYLYDVMPVNYVSYNALVIVCYGWTIFNPVAESIAIRKMFQIKMITNCD